MRLIASIFLFLIGFTCFAQNKSTREVYEHHHEALLNQDVPELLKDYDDESVLVTPDGKVNKGREQIRNTFEYAFKEMFPPNAEFKILQKVIEEEIVFLVYTTSDGETGEVFWKYAVDTFVIKDGKIKYQTVAIQLADGISPPNQD